MPNLCRPTALVAALLPVLATGALVADAAHAAGTIKAAYTETVIPARTYAGTMSVLNSIATTGPATGIFGVTSLTFTNFDTSPQQVFVFAPIFSNPSSTSCTGTVIGGSGPQMTVYVAPLSTLHLAYPTPLVYSASSGPTCIGAEVTTILHGGSVQINVNGVIN